MEFSSPYMGAPTAAAHWADVAPSGFRVLLEANSSLLRGGVGWMAFLRCVALLVGRNFGGRLLAGRLNGLFGRFAV